MRRVSPDDASRDPYLDPRHDKVGGAPAIMGPWQFDLLCALGLRPDDRLLDLGCGTLRGGLHFIGYLAVGHYTGVEPRPELLAIGDELVTVAGLRARRPRLQSLVELDADDVRYDWVLAQSVLNHLDEAGILETVDRVARALAPGGRWVATACLDEAVERVDAGAPHGHRSAEFWRSRMNPAWLASVLASGGLAFEVLPDAGHPRGLDVFIAGRRAS